LLDDAIALALGASERYASDRHRRQARRWLGRATVGAISLTDACALLGLDVESVQRAALGSAVRTSGASLSRSGSRAA
jgi:hypothetical protein